MESEITCVWDRAAPRDGGYVFGLSDPSNMAGSLVAEAVGFAAIGAIPCDAVTGKTPNVFIHAALADGEPAMPAFPAEPNAFAAAMAGGFRFSVFLPIGRNFRISTHRMELFILFQARFISPLKVMFMGKR